MGTLFWAIKRTVDKKEANLVQEPCQVSIDVGHVSLPRAKRVKFSHPASTLPSPQVLVNPQAVPKRTMLIALDDLMVQKAALADHEAKKLQAEGAKK